MDNKTRSTNKVTIRHNRRAAVFLLQDFRRSKRVRTKSPGTENCYKMSSWRSVCKT